MLLKKTCARNHLGLCVSSGNTCYVCSVLPDPRKWTSTRLWISFWAAAAGIQQ